MQWLYHTMQHCSIYTILMEKIGLHVVVVHTKHIIYCVGIWSRLMGGDGNDGGTQSRRHVTNDGHQRRNNRPHAGDKLWGFHKNSAYGVSQ